MKRCGMEVVTVALREFKNPYIAGSPLKTEEMFFGREDVFEHIRQHLVGEYQDNIIVLHGQKRTGKTSVLYQILNRRLLGEKYVPVYIDLQGMTQQGLGGFLHDMAGEIALTLGLAMPSRGDFEGNPGGYFRREFLRRVSERNEDRRLLLMLDEYEVLEDRVDRGKLEEEVFSFLRHLMQHYGNLGFIFAGSHKLEELSPRYWSIFRNVLYKEISFLAPNEARSLVAEPVKGVMRYTPDAVAKIAEMTSGHPYFLQLFCHHLVNWYSASDRFITVEDVLNNRLLNEVIQAGEGQLRDTWNDLSDEAKVVLLAASITTTRQLMTPMSTLATVLRRHRVRIGRKELNEGLGDLVVRDILLQEGIDYQFAVSFLQRWLDQNQRLDTFVERLDMVETEEPTKSISPADHQRYAAAIHLVAAGNGYREKGEYGLAIEKYEDAIVAYPDCSEAYFRLGICYEEQGKNKKARTHYEKALDIDPSYVEAWNHIGHLYKEEGKLELAIDSYEQALKYDPDDIVASSNRVEALYESEKRHPEHRRMGLQGMADEVIEMLREKAVNYKCPAYNPDCSDYIERVELALQQMDWDKALDLCGHGLALCSGVSVDDAEYCRAIGQMYRGAVYHAMGNLEEAEHCYRQSANVFSIMVGDDSLWNEAVARYALGLVAQSAGDWYQAQRLYHRSLHIFQRLGEKDIDVRIPELEKVLRRTRHLDFLRRQRQEAQERVDTVPIIGTTAAGEPILAIEVGPEDVFLDRINLRGRNCKVKKVLETGKSATFGLEPSSTYFALRVQGDSMTGIGIEDGDYVIFRRQPVVEQNEIAVVRIDDLQGSSSTVKRFYRQGTTILLKAENPKYQPQVQIFHAGDPTIVILGKVVEVVSVLE
jgi:SOS-response transcriptional repressor LexA